MAGIELADGEPVVEREPNVLDDLAIRFSEGEMVPHLEVKFVDDRFGRASLDGRLTARIGGAELLIGPIELQIAYKLGWGREPTS